MAQATKYKKIPKKTKQIQIQHHITKKMGVHATLEPVNIHKNIQQPIMTACTPQMHAMAGAQHEFSQICKNQKACLYLLKMLSLKNRDPGSLCKKWRVRVSHIYKPAIFEKNKYDNPGCRILERKFLRGMKIL